MDNEPRIRFSLKQLLLLIAGVAGILALGRYNPGLAVLLLFVIAGWVMRRYSHGHLGGIIPSLFGLFVMTADAYNKTQSPREPFFLDFTWAFGAIFAAIGIFVFLCVAAAERPFWRSQLLLAACVAAVLVTSLIVVPKIGNTNLAQRRTDDIASNKAAMAKSVDLIEGLRQRLGRVPLESEVDEMLEDFPSFQWDGYKSQISYHRFSNNQYRLNCCLFWEIYNYDSATPQKGWYSVPF